MRYAWGIAAALAARRLRLVDKGTSTVPAYGDHPATTVAAAAADPAACRTDAVAFGDAARDFLAHSGREGRLSRRSLLVLLRDALADFQARGCDRSRSGRLLRASAAPAQRQALVSGLPGLDGRGRQYGFARPLNAGASSDSRPRGNVIVSVSPSET